MAFGVAKNLPEYPVIVVKANSIGRFTGQGGAATGAISSSSSTPGKPDPMLVMCHLDSTAVGPMVEHVTKHMTPTQDVVYLVKTQAFERPGQLSMRSRRVFVQGRMSVAPNIKVEERAYHGNGITELPKVCVCATVCMYVIVSMFVLHITLQLLNHNMHPRTHAVVGKTRSWILCTTLLSRSKIEQTLEL